MRLFAVGGEFQSDGDEDWDNVRSSQVVSPHAVLRVPDCCTAVLQLSVLAPTGWFRRRAQSNRIFRASTLTRRAPEAEVDDAATRVDRRRGVTPVAGNSITRGGRDHPPRRRIPARPPTTDVDSVTAAPPSQDGSQLSNQRWCDNWSPPPARLVIWCLSPSRPRTNSVILLTRRLPATSRSSASYIHTMQLSTICCICIQRPSTLLYTVLFYRNIMAMLTTTKKNRNKRT